MDTAKLATNARLLEFVKHFKLYTWDKSVRLNGTQQFEPWEEEELKKLVEEMNQAMLPALQKIIETREAAIKELCS